MRADESRVGGRAGCRVWLRGVTTRWPGDEPIRLADVDVAAGRRLAVVGDAGAGMSTLAAVLLRILDYRGSITVNGTELRELAGDMVRRIVAHCGPDPRVVDAAARLERQRLALGRALLADFPVLVVDEPAPVADASAADAFLIDMLAAATGRTVLLTVRRALLPGAHPVLRQVDEVISVNVPREGAHPVPAGGALAGG